MTTTTQSPSEQITAEVTSWPGVSAGHGDRGEYGFRIGKRELGHLHGDRTAHFSFLRETADQLRREGRIGPHPAFPQSPTLASRAIAGPEDVRDVIALMRINYERVVARHGLPEAIARRPGGR